MGGGLLHSIKSFHGDTFWKRCSEGVKNSHLEPGNIVAMTRAVNAGLSSPAHIHFNATTAFPFLTERQD